MDKDLICVAICRRPQGIRGEIRVSVLLDNAKDITKLKELKPENKIDFCRVLRAYQLSDCCGLQRKRYEKYFREMGYIKI